MANDYITTGVGRMVQGDLFVPQTTDQNGNPLRTTQGADKQVYFMALALPKGPEWTRVWSEIHAIGAAAWPGGEHAIQGFSWKIVDGDSAENVAKEGFQGCWILRCSSGFAPKIYDNSEPPQQIIDPAMAPKGYYMQANIGVQGNKSAQRPGVYVNLNLVRVVAPGPTIQSGPSAAEAFATPAPAPVGALAAPPAAAPIAQPTAAPVQQHVSAVHPPVQPAPPLPAAETSQIPPMPGTAPNFLDPKG